MVCQKRSRSILVRLEVVMKIWENIKDRYLTWRTGFTRSERDYRAWCQTIINYRAPTIQQKLGNFRYIIDVDPDRFLDFSDPFSYHPVESAKQYFWPQRDLDNNCVWIIERVFRDPWTSDWHINSLGGEDHVFVATNSESDAIMIALKWK